MNRLPIQSLIIFIRQTVKHLLLFSVLVAFLCIHGISRAEGTKQLEPYGMTKSVCKLVLLQNPAEYRIPFALVGCSEEYRLNIRINDHNSEKIYLGFGNIIDYFYDTTIYKDVSFQVKDPTGNVVSGSNLRPMPPSIPGGVGFISNRTEVEIGPDINNSGSGGYKPLIISPLVNGDYYIEFQIPAYLTNHIRTFEYIDITVANGNTPVTGRLWSKAWQLGSGSTTAEKSASYSKFYIYTSDSIVTRFDCNGMAGGVWNMYSNEWGCSNTGSWNERRRSITGNTSVQPEYKIFLNDPDPTVFPSGHIGKMNEFKVLTGDCDTVITFATVVSKAGNIEIMIDLPPLNYQGSEDVKLIYKVNPGYNVLLPSWDGKDGYGVPIENGTQVKTKMSFLNGLSNVPLFDVEDNPNGFKVDLQRPLPVAGSAKLKLYWDDTKLPSGNGSTSNITDGCLHNGNNPISGCHEWKFKDNKSLGDDNTINSWWYLITDDSLTNPITVKFRPSSGRITGQTDICPGQSVYFQTIPIDFAKQYNWHLSGPGTDLNFVETAPDSSIFQTFPASMKPGNYSISVFGHNPQCLDGNSVSHNFTVHHLPVAAFANNFPCQGAGITFNDLSIAADATLIKSTWNVVQSVSGIQSDFFTNPAVIVFDDALNYRVTLEITDKLGCTDTVSKIITIIPKPNSDFRYTEKSVKKIGDLHFDNLSIGALSYFWDFGNNETSTVADPDMLYTFESNYSITLVATSMAGCRDTTTQQYYYMPGFWLPNAFSPGNDGINDFFRPVTQRTTLKPYKLLIYNRWGQLIFSCTNPDDGWDGTYLGKQCDAGLYNYVVQYRKGELESSETVTQRGGVSLIR